MHLDADKSQVIQQAVDALFEMCTLYEDKLFFEREKYEERVRTQITSELEIVWLRAQIAMMHGISLEFAKRLGIEESMP